MGTFSMNGDAFVPPLLLSKLCHLHQCSLSVMISGYCVPMKRNVRKNMQLNVRSCSSKKRPIDIDLVHSLWISSLLWFIYSLYSLLNEWNTRFLNKHWTEFLSCAQNALFTFRYIIAHMADTTFCCRCILSSIFLRNNDENETWMNELK